MRILQRAAVALAVVLIALVCLAVAVTRATSGDVISPIDVKREPTTARPAAKVTADGGPSVSERWRVSFPVVVVGLPAVDGSGIVATAGESEVVAVGLDGTVAWTTAVPGALVNAPRIDGDLVFVAAKRAVVALRRADGAVVWSVPTTADGDEDNRANRPVAVDGAVVTSTASGVVFAVDRASGAPRWGISLPTAIASEPTATSGVVVVVGIQEWWGIDPATGVVLWSGDLGLLGTSSPVVYDDAGRALAAVATDEHVVAVDARSGEPVWSTTSDQSELFQVPVVTSTRELLVPDHWGRVTAFDPHDGRVLWKGRGPDAVAEFGEPAPVGPQLVVVPLDQDGPRLVTPTGSSPLPGPNSGHGVAALPDGGFVVSTWDGTTNYLVAYDVKA